MGEKKGDSGTGTQTFCLGKKIQSNTQKINNGHTKTKVANEIPQYEIKIFGDFFPSPLIDARRNNAL